MGMFDAIGSTFGGSTNKITTGGNSTGITDLSIGFSKQGMQEYVESLRINLLEKSIEKINNTDSMMSAINAGWQGMSRDRFVEDFNNVREQIAINLKEEYKDLSLRLEELGNNYLKQDKDLYEKM